MVKDTLAALQNPSALLGNLREPLAAIYQELLAQAKMEKAANARNRVRSLGWQGPKSWVAWKISSETRTPICPVSGIQSCLEKLTCRLFLRNRRGTQENNGNSKEKIGENVLGQG